MSQNVLVKEYGSTVHYQWDASMLAAKGWEVAALTQLEQRRGCLRMIALGPMALIWKPRPKLIVTYRRPF